MLRNRISTAKEYERNKDERSIINISKGGTVDAGISSKDRLQSAVGGRRPKGLMSAAYKD